MMRYVLILLFTCAWLQNHAQVNVITTIAGTGETGYSGDNGPATGAKFNRPYAMCYAGDNKILICDGFNHVVRQIDLTTGIIKNVAGTGIGGFGGDNEPATDAQLFLPQGVYWEASGNIYISDGGNNRIRKISNSGIITTIAGTGTAGMLGDGDLAINAQLNAPAGIYVYEDAMYIADCLNNKVRKVDLVSGVISTVAGTGSAGYSGNNDLAVNAQLNGAIDIAGDKNGNLYISDSWNGVIRKLDAANGKITTIAGTGILGYFGDNGQATNANMNEPTGIFLDSHNHLFISDYRNGAIRKIDMVTGIISTVAGGIEGYGGDGGPAVNAKLKCTDVWVDEGENIYIADYVNNRMRKVNGALKVNDLNKVNELALSPNPTTGKFEVHSATNEGVITVCNMSGSVVFQSATFTAKTEVDISSQPPGMYMVYIQSGEDRYVSKVLRQ